MIFIICRVIIQQYFLFYSDLIKCTRYIVVLTNFCWSWRGTRNSFLQWMDVNCHWSKSWAAAIGARDKAKGGWWKWNPLKETRRRVTSLQNCDTNNPPPPPKEKKKLQVHVNFGTLGGHEKPKAESHLSLVTQYCHLHIDA